MLRYYYPSPPQAIGDPNIVPGLWVLVVTTVNPQTRLPLIQHRFFGVTQEDAQKRYELHMQADKFIASCGTYDGQVHEYSGTPCTSTWRWERT